MKLVQIIDSWVRSNLYLYIIARKTARYICRFIALEDGFDFLHFIKRNHDYVAIDVGSNDGTSIAMIHKFQRSSLIHSFDPIQVTPTRSNSITFHNYGLSNKEALLDIFTPKIGNKTLTQYSSDNKIRVIEQLKNDFAIENKNISFLQSSVRVTSLDILELKPYFLKIDVEGHELQVLQGSIQTLMKHRPIILVEIQNMERYREIAELLIGLGYFNLLWPQNSKSKKYDATMGFLFNQNNYIWIPKGSSTSWKLKDLIK
jgi:FkbM family methyltransferase